MWPFSLFKPKSLKEQERDLEIQLAANAAQLEVMTQFIAGNEFYDFHLTELKNLKAEDARLRERLRHLKEDLAS